MRVPASDSGAGHKETWELIALALTTLKEFLQPETVREASEILRSHEDTAMVIGGGTFIHGLVARGLVTHVEQLVDLSRLNLDQINFSRKAVRLGSSVTFTDLETSPEMRSSALLGALNDAVAYPPPQVKNAATIGGCVGASCPFLDIPIALLALDAIVTIAGTSGERKLPIEDLFVSLFQTSLEVGEFLTEFSVPIPSKTSASAFEKLETSANDLSIVSAAARLSSGWMSGKGARIFVGGGIGEVPFRCREAEAALENSKFTQADIERAAAAAGNEIEPFSDHRASAAYRKHMTGVLVRRCLERAAQQLES